MASFYSSSGGGSSGSVSIPQVTTDPASPITGAAWVLHTPSNIGGAPIGLLLALTQTVGNGTYQLSYKTSQGTVVRTPLTQD